MPGEIKVGAKFGTYEEKVKALNARSAKKTGYGFGVPYEFFDKNGKSIGNAVQTEDVSWNGGKSKRSYTITSRVTEGGSTYSAQITTTDGNAYYPNKFNRISTKTQYAIDKNANGIVDANEIFSNL